MLILNSSLYFTEKNFYLAPLLKIKWTVFFTECSMTEKNKPGIFTGFVLDLQPQLRKRFKPGVLLWDIGKQHSPRCDDSAASHLWLFCLHREISSKNEIKNEITLNIPKNGSGLTQLKMMGES